MAKKNSAVDVDSDTTTEAPETAVDETSEGVMKAPVEEAPVDEQHAAPEPDVVDETDPGKTLGTIAIVVSLVAGVVGFVLGLLAYRKARAAGFNGGTGMIAMVLGAIMTALVAVYVVLSVSGMGFGGACGGLQPGIHTLDDGTTISCR